jgi:two-component system, cell cycle sensor histidine kinase and response regulator CckA
MTAADRHLSQSILAFSQLVHDLKNQLAIVLACTDVVARVIPKGVADTELEALVKSAERASALSDTFLVGAVIGSHDDLETRPPVDLNTALRSTLPTLRRILGDRIEVRLRQSPHPLPIASDLIQIERILINLVLNARDAMPEGGTLTIETTFIPPAPRPPGGPKPPQVRLMVTDSGVGMTPEVKGRMFEPLFTTKPHGTGLGLNSVAYTIRDLDGTIAVDSAINRGTTVVVTLPLVSGHYANS